MDSNEYNDENGTETPSKLSSSVPIPEITIFRLNYWLKDVYDNDILQIYRNDPDNQYKVYSWNGDMIEEDSKSESKRNIPRDVILWSWYEIERKDIIDYKKVEDSFDPLRQKEISNKNNPFGNDLVSIVYNQNDKEKFVIQFNDYSQSDEKAIWWNNRIICLFRAPVEIYEAKGALYVIVSDRHKMNSMPERNLNWFVSIKMNLSDELSMNDVENKSYEDSSEKSIELGWNIYQSKISLVEKEVFESVCIQLNLLYTMLLWCPGNVISKSLNSLTKISSTRKLLILDYSNNPVYAYHWAQFLFENTQNSAFILLLTNDETKNQPAKKKKRPGSESEKRLDFDDDFKTKIHIKLEQFVNTNSSRFVIVSQANDKDYMLEFEETVHSYLGPDEFELAIDFRK